MTASSRSDRAARPNAVAIDAASVPRDRTRHGNAALDGDLRYEAAMLDLDPARPAVAPRDAATVILLREVPHGFAIFMVRRHAKSGFMAGAYVFPGGALDPADGDPRVLASVRGRTAEQCAAVLHEDDPSRSIALHVAAIRETFEEAGVLLADGVERVDRAAARASLHGETASWADVLERSQLELRLDALVPWARWITPEVEKRRFDARFFLAEAPPTQDAAHDRIEVTEGAWLTAAEALERWEQGTIQLAPPTLRTLETLRTFASPTEAIAFARARRPPRVCPVFRLIGEKPALVLPGDPEHPEGETAIEGPTRFVLIDGIFRSQDPD